MKPTPFKTLRALDTTTLGTKPLEITKPKKVEFANANGGLRMVTDAQLRSLASAAADNLLKADLGSN